MHSIGFYVSGTVSQSSVIIVPFLFCQYHLLNYYHLYQQGKVDIP